MLRHILVPRLSVRTGGNTWIKARKRTYVNKYWSKSETGWSSPRKERYRVQRKWLTVDPVCPKPAHIIQITVRMTHGPGKKLLTLTWNCFLRTAAINSVYLFITIISMGYDRYTEKIIDWFIYTHGCLYVIQQEMHRPLLHLLMFLLAHHTHLCQSPS